MRRPAEYGGPEVASQQAAYPRVVPYERRWPDAMFAHALPWRARAGWQIVAVVPSEGRIEATATTLLFGFKDDVVIRVTPTPRGSRVDVRSESRIGGSDVGTNAKRIEAFLDALARNAG
jgi:hypothetical protein